MWVYLIVVIILYSRCGVYVVDKEVGFSVFKEFVLVYSVSIWSVLVNSRFVFIFWDSGVDRF